MQKVGITCGPSGARLQLNNQMIKYQQAVVKLNPNGLSEITIFAATDDLVLAGLLKAHTAPVAREVGEFEAPDARADVDGAPPE